MELSLRLPVRPESVTAARHSLNGLKPLIAPPLLERLQLIVSELVTNSIRHARLGPSDSIGVNVAVSGASAKLSVADRGISFQPPSAPEPGDGSGFGLFLVEQVSTRWGVTNEEETTVWAELEGEAEASS